MFMPCERKVCVNMTITEDVVVHLTLETVLDQNCSILLDPSYGIIDIFNGIANNDIVSSHSLSYIQLLWWDLRAQHIKCQRVIVLWKYVLQL